MNPTQKTWKCPACGNQGGLDDTQRVYSNHDEARDHDLVEHYTCQNCDAMWSAIYNPVAVYLINPLPSQMTRLKKET